MATEALNLLNVVGFAGGVPDGLIVHGQTLIYPLGSTVVLRSKDENEQQEFLQGHTGQVSALALSPSGRYLASGQETYLGAWPAPVGLGAACTAMQAPACGWALHHMPPCTWPPLVLPACVQASWPTSASGTWSRAA